MSVAVALVLQAGVMAAAAAYGAWPTRRREVARVDGLSSALDAIAGRCLHGAVVEHGGVPMRIAHVVAGADRLWCVERIALSGEIEGTTSTSKWTQRNGNDTSTIPNPLWEGGRPGRFLERFSGVPVSRLLVVEGIARHKSGTFPWPATSLSGLPAALHRIETERSQDGVREDELARAWARLEARKPVSAVTTAEDPRSLSRPWAPTRLALASLACGLLSLSNWH